MNTPLLQFGNIPVSAAAIQSLFPHISAGSQKLRLLVRDNLIIRLKRGLYVCNPELTGIPVSTELIANHLCAPSYVSMSSALRYYGLIPEEVYTMQSMTVKQAAFFTSSLGNFEYTHISPAAFSIGVRSVVQGNYAFLMASPEKALCDLIASSPMLNLRFLKEAVAYIEDDIRMDMDDFKKLDPKIFQDYIQVGKKPDSIKTLLKLLSR